MTSESDGHEILESLIGLK